MIQQLLPFFPRMFLSQNWPIFYKKKKSAPLTLLCSHDQPMLYTHPNFLKRWLFPVLPSIVNTLLSVTFWEGFLVTFFSNPVNVFGPNLSYLAVGNIIEWIFLGFNDTILPFEYLSLEQITIPFKTSNGVQMHPWNHLSCPMDSLSSCLQCICKSLPWLLHSLLL